jgi:hypothetical protein
VQKVALLMESIMLWVLLGMLIWQRYQRTLKTWWKNWRAKPKRPWSLQPRTPDDCQDCRLAEAEVGPSRSQGRRPWLEVKSRGGRLKTHDSRGQACMNPQCEYYKDTDPDFHALRRDGHAMRARPRINGNAGRVGRNTPPDWEHRCTGSKRQASE